MSSSINPRTRSRTRALEVCLLAIALPGIVLGVLDLWPKQRSNDGVDVANYLGRSPFILTSTPKPVSLPISEEQLLAVAKKIVSAASAQSQSPSALLHATRLSRLVGPDVSAWMERDYAQRIVRLNLNSDVFQDSWRGIEARQTADGERTEHRDQFLAALAQFGVDLSCVAGRKSANQKAFQVRDLLRTSLAEFHLNQPELSWTATAFALYLPPQLHWFNRYGERFDFDDLARTLIAKPLHSESCSGIHLMLALTTIMKVDRDAHILREDTRTHLDKYLSMRVREAVDSQLPDGSWPVFWAKSGFDGDGTPRATPTASFSRRLTIGGHLLEWFQLLPLDRQPPEATIKRGLLWVIPQLLSLDDARFPAEICPCTHALLAVEGALRRNSNRDASASR
jgi:hypothetical protein